jgi:hypothetical protein
MLAASLFKRRRVASSFKGRPQGICAEWKGLVDAPGDAGEFWVAEVGGRAPSMLAEELAVAPGGSVNTSMCDSVRNFWAANGTDPCSILGTYLTSASSAQVPKAAATDDGPAQLAAVREALPGEGTEETRPTSAGDLRAPAP